MKVLLATDGSAHAEIALRLVASLAWPAGTAIRVVAALDTVHLAGPWATMAGEGLVDLQSESVDALGAIVGRAKGALATTGATVEGHVVLGRPSSVIVDGAAEFGADLIVVGSRGQGPIRTMLLGSVSAEVVDQARCPVLVARGPATVQHPARARGERHAAVPGDGRHGRADRGGSSGGRGRGGGSRVAPPPRGRGDGGRRASRTRRPPDDVGHRQRRPGACPHRGGRIVEGGPHRAGHPRSHGAGSARAGQRGPHRPDPRPMLRAHRPGRP